MEKYYKVNTNTKIMKENNFYQENIQKFKNDGMMKLAYLMNIDCKILAKDALVSSGIIFIGVTEKVYNIIDKDIKFIFKKQISHIGNTKVYEFKLNSKIYHHYLDYCKSHKDYQKLDRAFYNLLFWCTGKSEITRYKNVVLLATDGEVDENIMSSLTEIKAREYFKLQEESINKYTIRNKRS